MAGWRSGDDIASSAGALEFDSRVGQIRHKSPTARHRCDVFFGARSCVAQALSSGDGPRASSHDWA